MSTLVVYADKSSGTLTGDRDGAAASSVETLDGGHIPEGDSFGWIEKSNFTGLWMTFLFAFDTSALAGATVTSAVLTLATDGDFGALAGYELDPGGAGVIAIPVEARARDWTAPLDVTDWVPGADVAALTLAAHGTIPDYDNPVVSLDLDTDGLVAAINTTGMTRLLLHTVGYRTGTPTSAYTPGVDSLLVFRDTDPPVVSGPYLTIEYTAAEVATPTGAVWSTSAWQDVTPESVTATVKWGTSQPERGILSVPDAASWSIDMLDPLRLLDPANTDSPYWGDLVPYLPVRISHRGTIVRTGIAESIQHSFEDDRGYFRVTDKQSTLANAMVPAASGLRDGLYARAIDAISAAGVDCTVLPVPPSGDPEAAPWEEPTSDRSAWDWIADAALQLLHVPYIDRYGRLGFRPYSVPLARGRTLEAPELTGLRSIVQYQGLYSRVQVQQTPGDGGLLIERAVTPPPAYGTRTYIHTDPVPNADRWAQLILDDRAFSALRWVPGQMYPLTAESVEALATIEAVELVSIVDDYTAPVVRAEVIVLGGTIVLTAKKGDEAKWWFTFEAAQSPETPLVVSGSDPPEYLYRTAGAEFLYRSL